VVAIGSLTDNRLDLSVRRGLTVPGPPNLAVNRSKHEHRALYQRV
jgi:hypothetical protein